MKNQLWIKIAVLAVFVLSLMLSSCAPAAETPVEAPAEEQAADTEAAAEPPVTEPVTLNLGIDYIWDTANPATGWYNYSLRNLLYDTVVEWGPLDEFVPGLAESWSVSDDGLVWTFNIRENVTFHDGSPCTAEEIAWSINWVIENEIETMASYVINFAEVTALNPTTLQITLSNPVGNMEYLLIFVWILPPSVWGEMTIDEIGEFEDISAGIGAGPYKLVEWSEGEYLILEANENYWRGKPAIDRIVWYEYANQDALVQALLAGEIDMIGGDAVPFTAVDTLKQEADIEVPIMKSLSFDELILNSFADGTQPASLWDPTVRLAIEYAVDRQQIINVAYLGYGEPLISPIPPAMGDWYNTDLVPVPFDLAEGNRLLDEAGYVDSDGDGIREYSDGTPLAYRFNGTEGAQTARIMEIIADGLEQIGISAPPTLIDEDSLIALYPAYDFDLVYWGWGVDPDPDFSMLIFTCDQAVEYGWSDSGYCDEEFDALYLEQGVTVDHDARRAIIWKMQEKLYTDKPYIVLVNYPTIQAYNSQKFTGFSQECGDLTWKYCLLQGKPVQ